MIFGRSLPVRVLTSLKLVTAMTNTHTESVSLVLMRPREQMRLYFNQSSRLLISLATCCEFLHLQSFLLHQTLFRKHVRGLLLSFDTKVELKTHPSERTWPLK